jgi:hypothetical protein
MNLDIDSIIGFDSRRCGECPVQPQCEAGKIVSLAQEYYGQQIDSILDRAGEQLVDIAYIDEGDENSVPAAVEEFGKNAAKLRTSRDQLTKSANTVLYLAVKAQGEERSRHIKPDDRDTALDEALDECHELCETLKQMGSDEITPEILDGAGSDAASYAGRDICGAIITKTPQI